MNRVLCRLAALAAAVGLAFALGAGLAACQNITQAAVPAPPACPSGQHWGALSASQYGCVNP